jgi:hypothetical protein
MARAGRQRGWSGDEVGGHDEKGGGSHASLITPSAASVSIRSSPTPID